MNLQIVSNTILEGRLNNTNDFEMKLVYPIDALNTQAFLEVLSVSYPATTKNVNDNRCWFILQIFYDGFKKNENDTYDDNNMYIESDEFIIPSGIYSLKNLINYLNNVLNEFDIFFTIENNGKIKVNVNMYVEYWLNQTYSLTGKAHDGDKLNKYHLSSASLENHQKFFLINALFKFSPKFAFMLGFTNHEIHFQQTVDREEVASTTHFVFADFLPDISDGLDKIFIYCEELERDFVGDTSSELLTTVPIGWSEQGKGNGELITFSPTKIKRKFKKQKLIRYIFH